jgi:hypothetical protein
LRHKLAEWGIARGIVNIYDFCLYKIQIAALAIVEIEEILAL